MITKKIKTIKYYLALPWTYTVETSVDENNKKIYIVRVNKLPGVCTDAPSVSEAMNLIQDAMKSTLELYLKHGDPIPEPINEEDFKGNIAYRTSSKRHYLLAREAQKRKLSISKAIDALLDQTLEQ